MYPLVRELAVDGIPVTVTCRVLGFVFEQRVGVLREGREDALFDLEVLGGVNDAVAHVGEGLEVGLVRLGFHESVSPFECFCQADGPDAGWDAGAFYAQEPYHRVDAGFVLELG